MLNISFFFFYSFLSSSMFFSLPFSPLFRPSSICSFLSFLLYLSPPQFSLRDNSPFCSFFLSNIRLLAKKQATKVNRIINYKNAKKKKKASSAIIFANQPQYSQAGISAGRRKQDEIPRQPSLEKWNTWRKIYSRVCQELHCIIN